MSDDRKRALPAGWATATIGELIAGDGIFADGDWVETKDQDPLGDVRLIQLADVGDGVYLNRSSRFLTSEKAAELRCTFLDRDDVLIARMPEPLGRACVFPGDPKRAVTAVDVCIVRSGSRGADNRWLIWTINSPPFRRRIEALQRGTTRKRISRRNLGTICLAVPPLQEQRRIVAEIEKHFTRLEASVAELERAQANLKRYRAAVLRAACEGRLVPTEAALARAEGREYEPADVLLDRILKERRAGWEADQLAKMRAAGKQLKDDRWKTKYREPLAPDTSGLPELPEGWCWATMPQLGDVNRGKSKHRPRNDPSLLGGPYPFIQTGDVKHSGGTIRHHSQTYSEFGLSQSRLWPEGTLCITIAANIAETGILAYPACFPDSVVGFLFPDNAATVRFIELFFRTAKEDLRRFAPATAQKNINLEILSQLTVPLPPLAEQHRIVSEVERRLSLVDDLEAVVKQSLRRADRLRQALLKRAFEGKLVPQDPNDEPASALLERIRAERTVQAHARNSRRGRRASRKRRMRKTAASLSKRRTGVAE